jgi:hypothetical protein
VQLCEQVGEDEGIFVARAPDFSGQKASVLKNGRLLEHHRRALASGKRVSRKLM